MASSVLFFLVAFCGSKQYSSRTLGAKIFPEEHNYGPERWFYDFGFFTLGCQLFFVSHLPWRRWHGHYALPKAARQRHAIDKCQGGAFVVIGFSAYRRYSSPQSPMMRKRSFERARTASMAARSSAVSSRSNARTLSSRWSETPRRAPTITPATVGSSRT